MIDATGLTKKFGEKTVVNKLSFSVRSGMITGFLGPHGAGKSTTIRMILGLERPTKGFTRINGRIYIKARAPMTEVGALLATRTSHPGRTGRNHLRALTATHGIPAKRADELIKLVGLSQVAREPMANYSLAQRQRLYLAAALLGDPQTLILDEPMHGLDPEGVAFTQDLLKQMAADGRTVFISSHMMSEMSIIADQLIIIDSGRLVADTPMSDLIEKASGLVTKVRSPQVSEIVETIIRSGRVVKNGGDGSISIIGLTAEAIGQEATRRGWVLYELTPIRRSLEDIYLEMITPTQTEPKPKTSIVEASSNDIKKATAPVSVRITPPTPSIVAPPAPPAATSPIPPAAAPTRTPIEPDRPRRAWSSR